jgi:hypothetical protein
MDFGNAGDLHILPKLFSAWPASGVFFSTILYVILAALAALYLPINYVLCNGVLRAACVRHSFYPFLHNHVASPARALSLSKGRASNGA